MSGETPLAEDIKGYTIAVFKLVENDQPTNVVMEVDLRLGKVGGAHVKNPEDLIMLIEDAVFKEEQSG